MAADHNGPSGCASRCKSYPKMLKKIQSEIKLVEEAFLTGENSFQTIDSHEFTSIGGLIQRGRL